jgi:GAF domain-containing protein
VREKHRAASLLKCSEAIFSLDTCRAKARRVMQSLQSGLDCERGSLLLVDEVNSQQMIVSLDHDAAGLRIPLTAGVSGAVIASGRAIIIENAYSDSRFNQEVRCPGIAQSPLNLPTPDPGFFSGALPLFYAG